MQICRIKFNFLVSYAIFINSVAFIFNINNSLNIFLYNDYSICYGQCLCVIYYCYTRQSSLSLLLHSLFNLLFCKDINKFYIHEKQKHEEFINI